MQAADVSVALFIVKVAISTQEEKNYSELKAATNGLVVEVDCLSETSWGFRKDIFDTSEETAR